MSLSDIQISAMTMDDYEDVIEFWKGIEGMGLSSADSPEGIGGYIGRNQGFSLVARSGGKVVGAILAGHDGRRGFLHHLAVHPDMRGGGLGRKLSESCLKALKEDGIEKVHLFVFRDNDPGRAFWAATGWFERDDLTMFSVNL